MEDFWEGGVQDQGNALRQGFGKFHFQSAVSFSLGIEGIVVHFRCICCLYTGHVHSNQSSDNDNDNDKFY